MAISDVIRVAGDAAGMVEDSMDHQGEMTAPKMETMAAVAMAEGVAKYLEEKFGEIVTPEVQPVLKTNGEKLGITFRPEGESIAPTIYPEQYMEKWGSGEQNQVIRQVGDAVHEGIKHAPQIPNLTAEEARQHITLNVINTSMNTDLLAKTPHMPVLGGELSAIPRWKIDNQASFVVDNDMAARMGLTPEEVLSIGQKNLEKQEFVVRPMQDILSEMMGVQGSDMFQSMEGPQIMVLTSEENIQGANVLLSDQTLDQVHEMIGDYAVIPSSVHEVLAVPVTADMRPDDMRAMIHDVNMTTVSREERLSDKVFMHDGHRLSVVGDSFRMNMPKVNVPKVDMPKVDIPKVDGLKVSM